MTTGLCPRCQAADARAAEAATLEGLRQFENELLLFLLRPLPKAWAARLEPALCHARFRGLLKLIGGAIVGAVAVLITAGIGRMTGYYHASALIGLPLAISMIGLMEILVGINFADFAEAFDHGGILAKLGIAIVVLAFVAISIAGGVYVYQQYLS